MSKYDCSKTLDYAHEAQRMCEAVKQCADCPTRTVERKSCTFIDGTTQERIDIVQKWSNEHPEKTRKEAFLEIFPKYEGSVIDNECFESLVGKECCRRSETCDECWQEPYNGEFEKAREMNK